MGHSMSHSDTSSISQLNVDLSLYNPSNNVDLLSFECPMEIKNASISSDVNNAHGCSSQWNAIGNANSATGTGYNYSVLINEGPGDEIGDKSDEKDQSLHDLLGKHSAEKLYPLGVSFGTELRHWERCAGPLVGTGMTLVS
jgi:hypothetical protein